MDNLENSDFWKDQGNNYYKTGNYIDAIICYKRALEINPESDKAWYNLGMAYNRMNNKKDSKLCFEKSQELSAGKERTPLKSRSPVYPETAGIVDILHKSLETPSTREPEDFHSDTDWRELLYPGEWSVRFVLVGLLVSVSDKPVFIFMYYTCAIAALIALAFLLLGLVQHVKRRHSGVPGPLTTIRANRSSNPLSSSSMNARTWAIFFLICFVALLWAVFLNNQGMMLWVGFALVIIVAGFNLIFIFRN